MLDFPQEFFEEEVREGFTIDKTMKILKLQKYVRGMVCNGMRLTGRC